MNVIRMPWEIDHWDDIKNLLDIKYDNISSFINLLLKINSKCPTENIKNMLEILFNDENSILSSEEFFTKILPYIQKISREIKERSQNTHIFPMIPQIEIIQSIPRYFVSSIIACTFLGIFDYYNPVIHNSKYNFGKLSFIDIYTNNLIEPFKCILHYLKSIYILEHNDQYAGNIIIYRNIMEKEHIPPWKNIHLPFLRVLAVSEKQLDKSATIDFVNFANKLIGGEILDGNSQSCAMILSRTESLIVRMCCAQMDSNESIIVMGCEKFCDCDYTKSSGFKFIGNFIDDSEISDNGTIITRMIFIDATLDTINQYDNEFYRDLNKSLLGLYSPASRGENPLKMTPIATGMWGYNVAKTNKYIKALQQILAAALSKRDLIYYTENDEIFAKEINDFSDFLVINNCTISNIINTYEKIIHHWRIAGSGIENIDMRSPTGKNKNILAEIKKALS